MEWEAARPCVSKEAKPAKIVSLIEKRFCARPLKEKEIFAGFVRRQAASRWGGLKISVRIFFKKSSDFVQKVPLWAETTDRKRIRGSHPTGGLLKSEKLLRSQGETLPQRCKGNEKKNTATIKPRSFI
jgi:hypothetical protein